MTLRKQHNRSEPEILLDVTGAVPAWGVAIGLVGEGQEIHVGEEAGLGQWAAADPSEQSFNVHVPPHLASVFAAVSPQTNEQLNLTCRFGHIVPNESRTGSPRSSTVGSRTPPLSRPSCRRQGST